MVIFAVVKVLRMQSRVKCVSIILSNPDQAVNTAPGDKEANSALPAGHVIRDIISRVVFTSDLYSRPGWYAVNRKP